MPLTERPTRHTLSQRHGPNRVALAQKNMTKSRKGTTPQTGTTVPEWPRPRSGKLPDEARQEITTKANLLGLCVDACFAAIQQYSPATADELYKKITWTYRKALNQKREIKYIMDGLQDVSPEEHTAYMQIDTTVENLREVMEASLTFVAGEIRAETARTKEARLKAEEEAKLKAETDAKAKAAKEAWLKAKLEAENKARLKAEGEAKLRAAIESIEVKAQAEKKANLKAKEEARLKAEAEAEPRTIESNANAQMQNWGERADKLRQEMDIWQEIIKRTNGHLTANQTTKFEELKGKTIALQREAIAGKKAMEAAKLESKTVKAKATPEPPKPEP